jgi:hypothetical protein
VGRIGEAESLASTLQRNGERLDRAWMLAIGARCRSMLLAAAGDLDAAMQSTLESIAQHDRLAMPFELARTQLLLGQLQRRSRRRDAAAATLREAIATFERLDTPLWGRCACPGQPADGVGAARRRACRLRDDQPRRRWRTVHQRQDRRSQPHPDLPQTRHPCAG